MKTRAPVFVAVSLWVWLAASPGSCRSAELKAETVQGFDRYVQLREQQIEAEVRQSSSFLQIEALPEPSRTQAYADLKRGEIVIERFGARDGVTDRKVPGGLVHHWMGTVFVARTSILQALALAQDYDHHQDFYRPEVRRSKLLERSGDNFKVFLRLKRAAVVTVTFNTEHDVQYVWLDAVRAYSRSYSTRIAEVEHADQVQEHEKPPGQDRGFLWRLYSYWRFYQADGGVYIECEAISLTRDVPAGLGWIVRPFIENIPRESLSFTLGSTRKALLGGIANSAVSAGGEAGIHPPTLIAGRVIHKGD